MARKKRKLLRRIRRAAKDNKITKKEIKKISAKFGGKSPKKIAKKIKAVAKDKDAQLPKKRLKKIIRRQRREDNQPKDNNQPENSNQPKDNNQPENSNQPENGNKSEGGKKPEETTFSVKDLANNERESGRTSSTTTTEEQQEIREELEQDIADLQNDLDAQKDKTDRYKNLANSLKKINNFSFSDAVNFKPKYKTNKGGMKDAITLVKQNSEKLYDERSKLEPPQRIGDYTQNTTKELKQRIKEISGKNPMKFFKEKNMKFKGGTIGKNKTLRINKKGKLVKRDLSNDPYGFEAIAKAEKQYSKMVKPFKKEYENTMQYIQKDPTKPEKVGQGILTDIKSFSGVGDIRDQAKIDLGIKKS